MTSARTDPLQPVDPDRAQARGSVPAGRTTAVRLERVVKRYGDVTAVAGVDLDILDG